MIYVLAFCWFCFICGVYMISFWLPTLIKDMGVSNPLHVGLLAAIPYGISTAGMIAIGIIPTARWSAAGTSRFRRSLERWG